MPVRTRLYLLACPPIAAFFITSNDKENQVDLKALQSTLRQFAAERDWQAFHTPKNLAMALMVEAAELAELFQWMTPEQSLAVAANPQVQERAGEEIADVLLYLLQLADHTGVDIDRAVARKLVMNGDKYPALRRP